MYKPIMENILLVFLSSDIRLWTDHLLPMISKCQAQIEESRFIDWEEEIGGLIRISGNWNALAKLENALTHLKADTLYLKFKRITPAKRIGSHLPYIVQIVGINKSNSIEEIMHFFSMQSINIVDAQTDSFTSSYSEANLLNLSMRLQIPDNLNITSLREQFMLLCEEINVDGLLEPEKIFK